MAPSIRVSVYPWMEASGVRSSCETLITKSLRTRSTFSSSACSRCSCSTVCCRFSAVSFRVLTSWPNSLLPDFGRRARKLPPRQFAGVGHDRRRSGARSMRASKAPQSPDGRQKRQRRAGQDLDPDLVDLPVDLRERHRDADGAARHRHRHVQERNPDRRAVPLAPAVRCPGTPGSAPDECGGSPSSAASASESTSTLPSERTTVIRPPAASAERTHAVRAERRRPGAE